MREREEIIIGVAYKEAHAVIIEDRSAHIYVRFSNLSIETTIACAYSAKGEEVMNAI